MNNDHGSADVEPVAPRWIRTVAFVQPLSGVIVFAFAVVLPGQLFFGNPGWTGEQNQARTLLLSVLGVIAVLFWLLGKTSRVKQYLLADDNDDDPSTA